MSRRFLILLGCIAALLVVALPATAANHKPQTGTKIGLFAPPATFPANTPFFVEHGFVCPLGDRACMRDLNAHAVFKLYINDVLQKSTIDVDVSDGFISRMYLSNFAAGLPAGTYTFTGVWIVNGVVTDTRTATIDFT